MRADGTEARIAVKRWVFGRNPRMTALRVVVLILGATAVFGWILLPVRAHGISMRPTYGDGTLLLVNRTAYRWTMPSRGDVVAIRMAGWRTVYVKRIVALPGERVAITNGILLVNDQPVSEPYVKYRSRWQTAPVTLAGDEYFVVGDNRGMAQTSHEFGKVKRDRIVGKVVF